MAGALGPTNKTASLSPDVQNPAYRAITYDQLVAAYYEQTRALVEGGVDLLLVETVFDSLNSKAALFASTNTSRKSGRRRAADAVLHDHRPERTDPSGQTVEAYWNSVSHMPLLSIGINCALGPKEMRPFIEELSRIADIYVSAYPNAGLPNPMLPTGFPETPESLAPQLQEWAANGWLNIVGGCCGTTPEHIRQIAEAVRELPPRSDAEGRALHPAERPGSADHPAGNQLREHRRAHERHRVTQVRQADPGRRLRSRAGHRAAAGRERRPDHRRQHGRGDARLREGDDHVS